MFSRSSQLPIDLTMLTPTEIRTSWPDYVKNWKEQMKKTYRASLQHSDDDNTQKI